MKCLMAVLFFSSVALADNVCTRQADIVKAIEGVFGQPCDQITNKNLGRINYLAITVTSPLSPEDFNGFSGLISLQMTLKTSHKYPADIFSHLKLLNVLKLEADNPLDIYEILQNPAPADRLYISSPNLIHLDPGSLAHWTNVKTLEISGPQLLTIKPEMFQYFPNLNYLKFQDTSVRLTADIFTFAPNLTKLEIVGGRLSGIEAGVFKPTPKITEVSFSSTYFPWVEKGIFESLPQLDSVTIYDSELETIVPGAFKDLPALSSLNFSGNKIEHVTPILFPDPLPAVTNLSFNQNKIRDVAMNSFQSFPNLKVLDLVENEIQELPAHAFKGLANLRTLNMNHNLLRILPADVFTDLTSLDYLNLEDNKILYGEPNAFDGLKLSTLDTCRNDFGELSADTFKGLTINSVFYMYNTRVNQKTAADLKTLFGNRMDIR